MPIDLGVCSQLVLSFALIGGPATAVSSAYGIPSKVAATMHGGALLATSSTTPTANTRTDSSKTGSGPRAPAGVVHPASEAQCRKGVTVRRLPGGLGSADNRPRGR